MFSGLINGGEVVLYSEWNTKLNFTALSHFSNPTFDNLMIVDNSTGGTGDGAGIFINEGVVSISNSTFSGNSAIKWGGGLFIQQNSVVTIDNCTFIDNSVSYNEGGAIAYINNVDLNVSNSIFKNNTAVDTGGALFSNVSSSGLFEYCLFKGNYSNVEGGAYKGVDHIYGEFKQSTIADNTMNYNQNSTY